MLGDPAEADFTQMLQDDFGWKTSGAPGRFDILPLLLQANPNEAPQVSMLMVTALAAECAGGCSNPA